MNVSVVKTFLNPKNYNKPESDVVLKNVSISQAMSYVKSHPNNEFVSYTIHRVNGIIPDASTLYAAARVA